MFLSYREWKEQQRSYLECQNSLIECPTCGGCGWTECDCCGGDSKCNTCDGLERVRFNELETWEQDEHLSFGNYEKALKADATAYARFVDFEKVQALLDVGVVLATPITTSKAANGSTRVIATDEMRVIGIPS